MALIDTLGAAQRGATAGMQNYANWLANAQATNQLAANAVQSDIDAANQAARYAAGIQPAATGGYNPMDLNVGLRTPGGEVEQKSVQYNPVKNGQVALPIYAPASPPPGPAVPAAPAAPAAGAPTAPVAPGLKPPTGSFNDPADLSTFDKTVGPNAVIADRGLTDIGYEIQSAQNDLGWGNVIGDFFLKPSELETVTKRRASQQKLWEWFKSKRDFFVANPDELVKAKANPAAYFVENGGRLEDLSAEPAAATTPAPAAPSATTQPGVSAVLDTMAAQETATPEAATTQPAGLTPPPEGGTGEPVDMSPVSLVTNPQARAKLSDADLDYRNTGLMDNRNLIIQMFNREVGNMRADAARNDQLRVQQYNALMQQAQAATTAGNTGYAQGLINKADALLQEASDAATTQRQAMDTLQSNAQKLLNDNETELLANQAVIAEREFTVGNNPSRMLSMLEAYGFGGVNLEGMPNGKLRIVLPAEGGGITYYTDQSGNPAEMTKQEFVNFFMGTLSEDIRAKQIEAQAAQAADNLKFQRELEKISFESYADAQKEIAKGLGEDTYATKINDDGSITYTPKDPTAGLPIILVRPEEGANGMTQYRPQFINVAGVR